jgi:hypothetical protein
MLRMRARIRFDAAGAIVGRRIAGFGGRAISTTRWLSPVGLVKSGCALTQSELNGRFATVGAKVN